MVSMTSNEQAVVDESAFTVRRTITIAAPIDRVWSAVTDPAHISRWFGRVALDGAGAGATGTITWPDRPSIPLRVESSDEPNSVSYRWCNDDAADAPPEQLAVETSTVFTFTLESLTDGTRLTVVETGFDATSNPASNMADHRTGWTAELDKLVALLEGGA